MCNWWFLGCVLLYLCAEVSNERTALDSPVNTMFLRYFRNMAFDIFGRTGTEGGKYLDIARKANKVQETIPEHVSFPCNVTGGRSQDVPDSVHKLRPGDIDVIAAMGDSLTAGAGIFADNVFQVTVENRGVSAAGGGQRTWRQYLTIPNIIKEFNPNLIGYALGDSLTSHDISQLNVAESGAFSEDMPYMAEVLVKRIKNDSRINLKKHWKFISLMIGSNNFCVDICWVKSLSSVLEKHKADMLKVLRTLRDNLPRTFVALIPPPHMKTLTETGIERTSLKCFLTTDFECSCLYGLRFRSAQLEYYDIMKRWQELDIEIASYPEFNTDDFAVVAQPILTNITMPTTPNGYVDTTYFSSDCFHLSQKSQSLYANGLWNNLLESCGSKSRNWNGLLEKFLCPTSEKPYLATMLNS